MAVTLGSLPVGSRLIVRSRKDWRFAAVARLADERVVLTVASPRGCNYWLRRDASAPIELDGSVPVLAEQSEEDWRENFGEYDRRW